MGVRLLNTRITISLEMNLTETWLRDLATSSFSSQLFSSLPFVKFLLGKFDSLGLFEPSSPNLACMLPYTQDIAVPLTQCQQKNLTFLVLRPGRN
jgi:hypothetical protein